MSGDLIIYFFALSYLSYSPVRLHSRPITGKLGGEITKDLLSAPDNN